MIKFIGDEPVNFGWARESEGRPLHFISDPVPVRKHGLCGTELWDASFLAALDEMGPAGLAQLCSDEELVS